MAYSESQKKTIINKICKRIADGESLRTICKDEDLPNAQTIDAWLGDNNEFSKQYARARVMQADYYAEQIIYIADDNEDDLTIGEDGVAKRNPDSPQRSRLRMDARKWYASKLAPKKYGDRLEIETIKEAPDTSKLTKEELLLMKKLKNKLNGDSGDT